MSLTIDDELIPRRPRPAVSVRKPSARKGNGNGTRNPRASVTTLDHHRLYREIEQLRRHGQEVLERTRQMMNLLAKTLKRAQVQVDEQNRWSAEMGSDPTSPVRSRKSSAERPKNKHPSRIAKRARPAWGRRPPV